MTGESDTRPLRDWLATEPSPISVLVVCRENEMLDPWRSPEAGVRRVLYRLDGCLADLPPAAILEMLAGGAAGVTGLLDGCTSASGASDVLADAIRLGHAVCPTRPVTSSAQPVDAAPASPSTGQRSRRARRLRPTRAVEVLDARSMPLSRRRLIGVGRRLAAPDPNPSARLISVVRELIGDAPIPTALLELPTGVAELEARACSGTGVCVRVCPGEALTLTLVDLGGEGTDAQQFALSMDSQRCLDCGLCVQLCPETAMTRSGPLDWSQALDPEPRTLRVGLVRPCPGCGTPHHGREPLCTTCTFRAANPFGSRLPPGFTRSSSL